ncbi:MAG TPA: hypothetical protein VK461_07285 [Acidimicrobiales bacterium]|nr:hypothetical protein [Acidimicrobiales bacterium]
MQADLTAAMKERDPSRVAVLRATLGALANAEAVDAPSGPVSLTERAELLAAADERDALGLPDDAADLRGQAAVLTAYL